MLDANADLLLRYNCSLMDCHGVQGKARGRARRPRDSRIARGAPLANLSLQMYSSCLELGLGHMAAWGPLGLVFPAPCGLWGFAPGLEAYTGLGCSGLSLFPLPSWALSNRCSPNKFRFGPGSKKAF